MTKEADVMTIWLLVLPPVSFGKVRELKTNLTGETKLIEENSVILILFNPLDPTILYKSDENERCKVSQFPKTTIKIGEAEYLYQRPNGFLENDFYSYESFFGFKNVSKDFPKGGVVLLKKRDLLTNKETPILKFLETRNFYVLPSSEKEL